MRFYTFFDARDAGLSVYGPGAMCLILILVGVGIAIRGGSRGRALPVRVFGIAFAVGAAAILTVFVTNLTHRQAEISRIMAQHDYQVVEGAVADFQPVPSLGHGVERFRVGSTWLGYRGPTDTGGFHQLRADGGPIADGRRVRMAVDRQGRILKLELAE